MRRRAGRALPVVVLGCLLVTFGVPAVGLAHKYHVTIAELELNDETRRLEVALRATPEDLERALERRYDVRIDLERSENIDEMIAEYLAERFVIESDPPDSTDDPEVDAIIWVGKEISPQAAWLYFEIPIAVALDRLALENRIFFELEETQLNTVNVKHAGARSSVTFTHETPRQSLLVEKIEERRD